ncbi:MAG: hypothetical protein AAFY65_10030 [Pseudomonadota bacterium]
MIRAALALITALAIGGPSAAAPNAQLVASVQNRLDRIGFTQVDARTLSTRQIAALHMELQGRAFSRFGPGFLRTREKVKVILGWDAPSNGPTSP